jgi:transcriptional regulator with XRE-family HTH domain
MNLVAEKIKEVDISLKYLCEETGLSSSTIYRVIKGDKVPASTRIDTLEKIANTLNCSIIDFFQPAPLIKSIIIDSRTEKVKNDDNFSGKISLELENNCSTVSLKVCFKKNYILGHRVKPEKDFFNTQTISNVIVLIDNKNEDPLINGFFKNNTDEKIINTAIEIIKKCQYKFGSIHFSNIPCQIILTNNYRKITCVNFQIVVELGKDKIKRWYL